MADFKPDFKLALKKDFYIRDTETVARELIGKVLVRRMKNGYVIAGRIVETEAYLADNDFASHSATGKSKRNAPMFEDGGIIYVYKIYGIHHCLNIVTETAGKGCAVLLRGLEPVYGIDNMIKLRGTNNINNLCMGPGNLAKSFDFKIEDNFKSIIDENLFVQDVKNKAPFEILKTKRIGITKSACLPLRFKLKI